MLLEQALILFWRCQRIELGWSTGPRAGAAGAALELGTQKPLLHQLVEVEPGQPARNAHALSHLVLANQTACLAHSEKHTPTRAVAKSGHKSLNLHLVVGEGGGIGGHRGVFTVLTKSRIALRDDSGVENNSRPHRRLILRAMCVTYRETAPDHKEERPYVDGQA